MDFSNNVRKVLQRYMNIVEGKALSKYLIAKRVGVDFNFKESEDSLWIRHEGGLKDFYRVQKGLDSGKIILDDLSKPEKSLLDLKIELAKRIMTKCEFCERKCSVNRLKDEKGFCNVGKEFRIFGAHAHFGEEVELVPSGTIFLSGCSMKCVYCQNYPHSITPELGKVWMGEKVATWINNIYGSCRNVNFVSPDCYLWSILKSLKPVKANLPIVWNSNSYFSKKTAELIRGIVDVYLLDFRYFNEDCAVRLSSAQNYPEVAKRNHLTANKDAEILIRILVMPNHLECDAKPILKWIRVKLGENARVNILPQYRPCFRAFTFSDINRLLEKKEHEEVVKYAKEIGLKNLVGD